MQKHLLVTRQMSYPIGIYIQDNIPIIKTMAEAIYLVVDEYYKNRDEIDLVCKGSSGAIIAGLVSTILNTMFTKRIIIHHIKKNGENSHSGSSFPNVYSNSVIIVIDDFISSGTTISSIIDTLNDNNILKLDILCVSGNILTAFDESFTHGICSE